MLRNNLLCLKPGHLMSRQGLENIVLSQWNGPVHYRPVLHCVKSRRSSSSIFLAKSLLLMALVAFRLRCKLSNLSSWSNHHFLAFFFFTCSVCAFLCDVIARAFPFPVHRPKRVWNIVLLYDDPLAISSLIYGMDSLNNLQEKCSQYLASHENTVYFIRKPNHNHLDL